MTSEQSSGARAPGAPLLLYDGVCNFCNHTVSFVLRHDRAPAGAAALRFAALESAVGAAVVARHPELAGVDSVVWVEAPDTDRERVHVRTDAALRLAGYLGWPWRAAAIFSVVPRGFRDYWYDLFARYRYRMFGRLDACEIPPPEWRARFLDLDEREASAEDRDASMLG